MTKKKPLVNKSALKKKPTTAQKKVISNAPSRKNSSRKKASKKTTTAASKILRPARTGKISRSTAIKAVKKIVKATLTKKQEKKRCDSSVKSLARKKK